MPPKFKPRPTGVTPTKDCSHRYSMVFEEDHCECVLCDQEWRLTEYGWKPLSRRQTS
jgi:hypothetical protein